MADKFRMRLTTFSDGERYPLLLDQNGVPHWHTTLFTTTQVRNASKAPNTMAAVVSSIRLLLGWAQSNSIDLDGRFARQKFLTTQELESLCSYTQAKGAEPEIRSTVSTVSKLPRANERARAKPRPREDRVTGTTQYIRMSYVADYLKWLAIRLAEREARHVAANVEKQIDDMVDAFRARRPQKSKRANESARIGLSENQRSVLLDMVKVGSPKNPFSLEVQGRNELIILLLYHLGLREGELLALRISDFDFQGNTVLIARRHDNPDDPRNYQPVVKTLDRRLPLADHLMKAVSDYILRERTQIPGAKKHNFLFVTHKAGPFQGSPLSIKGLIKIFKQIQRAAPEELGNLTAHVLRHTANDRFSELMDQKETTQSQEEKMRSYIMGWKEGSGTAATYTKRHTRKKAREAALKLQKPLADDMKDKK